MCRYHPAPQVCCFCVARDSTTHQHLPPSTSGERGHPAHQRHLGPVDDRPLPESLCMSRASSRRVTPNLSEAGAATNTEMMPCGRWRRQEGRRWRRGGVGRRTGVRQAGVRRGQVHVLGGVVPRGALRGLSERLLLPIKSGSRIGLPWVSRSQPLRGRAGRPATSPQHKASECKCAL